MSTQGQVCTFFLQSACIHGAKCRFLHRNDSWPSPNDASSSATTVCAHFLRGSCRYGDRCRQPHSTDNSNRSGITGNWADVQNEPDADENAVNDSWAVNDPWNTKDPWGSVQVASSGRTDSPPRQQAASSKPHNNRFTVPCRYFELGQCTRGDSCTFKHLGQNRSWRPSGIQNWRSYNDRSAVNVGRTFPPKTLPQQPCQFFVRGQCPRGDVCPFIHENSEPAIDVTENGTSSESSLCQLYLKGRCLRGSTCPFLHNNDIEEETPMETQVVQEICQFNIAGKCTRGGACPFRHAPADTEPPSPDQGVVDPCQFFIRGKCPRGDDCSFSHVLAESSDSIEPSLTEADTSLDHTHRPDASRSTEWSQNNASNREPCKYFDLGNCFRGSACRYVHASAGGGFESHAGVSESPSGKKQCRFFLLGNCRNGDDCTYSHEDTDGGNADEQAPVDTWADQPSPSPENDAAFQCTHEGECTQDGVCCSSYAGTDDKPIGTSREDDVVTPQNQSFPEVSENAGLSRPLCKYFSQGYCMHGAACQFRHGSTDLQGRANEATTTDLWSAEASTPTHKRICQFFAKGCCKYGTSCSYRHISNSDQQGEANTYNSTPAAGSCWQTTSELPCEEGDAGTSENEKRLDPWTPWGYDEEPQNDWFSSQSQTAGSEKGDVAENVNAVSPELDHQPPSSPGVDTTTKDVNENKSLVQPVCQLPLLVNAVSLEIDHQLPTPPGIDTTIKDVNENKGLVQPVCRLPLLGVQDQNIHGLQTENGVDPSGETQSLGENVLHVDDEHLTTKPSFEDNTPHLYSVVLPKVAVEQRTEGESDHLSVATPADAEVESQKSGTTDTGITPDSHAEMNDTVDGYIFNSTVTFGPGATVQRVVTAFESRLLILSNLPEDVRGFEVKELAEPFGETMRVLLERSDILPTAALVEFINCADAARAAWTLDKTEYRSTTLTATLELRSGSHYGKATDALSRTVKISWSMPSLTGWAYYPSISQAKEQAKCLQGMILFDRKIAVSYISPRKKQMHSFTVELKNLPSNTTRDDIKDACPGSSSASVAAQTNYDREESILGVRHVLAPYQPIDFYVLPPETSKVKIIAFASFQSGETVSTIAKELHRTKQECLKNNSLFVEPTFSVKHELPLSQFTILKGDLDHLRDTYDKECRIRFLDRDENGEPISPVSIHIDGSDPKTVGHARRALDTILCGEALFLEDGLAWDDHFDSPDSATFFTSLNADTRFYIKCSRRYRSLRYFSRQVPLNDARELVIRQLRLTRSHRHNLPVSRGAIRPLLTGHLRRLRDDDAISVTLNVISRTLTVRSENQNDIKKVKRVLAELNSDSSASTISMGSTGPGLKCSVCTWPVLKPITLPCGHVYCEICLRHILRSLIGCHAGPLMCMIDQDDSLFETSLPCYTEFPLKVIREFLSERDERKLFEFSLLSYVRQHPEDLHFCPTPNCPIFYRTDEPGNVLRCPACQKRICPYCHIQFHEGLSCTQYQEA